MENSGFSYLVTLKTKTKNSQNYFVVTQVRRDEFGNPAVFHGIGFWTTKLSDISEVNKEEINQKITEVWIPWECIDHVESLMYRQRG